MFAGRGMRVKDRIQTPAGPESDLTDPSLAVAIVAIAVLLLAAFTAFLRLDREGSHRTRFESLHADFLTGLDAVAVTTVFDALQRLIDLANQLALAIACAQFQAEFRFLGRTIVWIGE